MTVFAACAIAGAAMAVDSNIVGYTTKNLVANQKAISGAQFVEVGDTVLDIQSIKLENIPAEGGAFLQWWNGTDYNRAAWVELDYDPDTPGWGDENDWEVPITRTFTAGSGFWIVVPSGVSNAKATQAGEVALSQNATYDFALAANRKFIVINPLPTDLSIADIKLVNVPAEGGAFLQWWNGVGYERAAWVELDYDSSTPGWGDENDWEVAISRTFKPTDGFWLVVPSGVSNPQVKIVNQVTSL